MTDPIDPGVRPDATPPSPASWPPPADPAPPPFEAAEPGAIAPAQAVHRDEEAAFAARTGRSNIVRWAIAIVGVVLVLGVTAAVFALTAGRPNPSVAVGYMPDNVVQYGEYRLDLPGDQRQKVAEFLSVFPGFKDQSTFDSKLDETFDKIVAAVSSNQQTYTADIKPWFGGIVAMGSTPPTASQDATTMLGSMGGEPLIVVTVTDQAKAADWIASLDEASLTRGEYNGAVLFSGQSRDVGPAFAIAVTDKVILAGTDAAVKKAVDSNGNGKLADDDQFKAAFKLATDDYVTFSFVDYQASLASYLDMIKSLGGSDALDKTAVDDELVSLVPAWFGSVGRFESDALVASSAFPSVDIGYDGHNKKSTLLGWAPPGTIAYAEVHDAGAAFNALLERFRKLPEVAKALQQIDSTTGIGLDGIFGWWGDTALMVSEDGSGHYGGGLVIVPADAAKAKTAEDTLKVVDFSGAMGGGAGSLPAGYKPELAFTFTDKVVVVGYGQAFVESVLDAGPGPSLADDSRVASLVKRVGEENLGFTYLDVRAMREVFETLAKAQATPEKWSQYVKEYQPFLLPFDAMAGSVRKDGDLNRIPTVVTVSKP
jgi:hypothetical protein